MNNACKAPRILVPSVIFIFSRDFIFHGLDILRGRGKSRIDPGSEDEPHGKSKNFHLPSKSNARKF